MIRYSTGGGFTPLPEGKFALRIDSVTDGVSSKGNPQITIDGEIVAGDDEQFIGSSRKIFYSLVENAVWRIGLLCEALGLERVDTGEVDAKGQPIYSFDEQALVGRVVEFNVTQREYQGKTQNDFQDPTVSPEDPYYQETLTILAERQGGAAPDAAPASQAAPATNGGSQMNTTPAAAATGPGRRRATR